MKDTKRAAKAASNSDQPQQTKAPDKSGGSDKASWKAKLKKIFQKMGKAMACIAPIVAIACNVEGLADHHAGGGHDGGDYKGDDQNHNAAADA